MNGSGMGNRKTVRVCLDEILCDHEAGKEEAEQADGDSDVHEEFAPGDVLGVGEKAAEGDREAEPGGDERGGMGRPGDHEEVDSDTGEDGAEVESESRHEFPFKRRRYATAAEPAQKCKDTMR